MARKIKTTRMHKVCQTEDTVEFTTPDGGSLTYGSCRRHGYFMAMVHCPTADVRRIASALLEAVEAAEHKRGGQQGNQGAGKTPTDETK
jgi:hypothetical protein